MLSSQIHHTPVRSMLKCGRYWLTEIVKRLIPMFVKRFPTKEVSAHAFPHFLKLFSPETVEACRLRSLPSLSNRQLVIQAAGNEVNMFFCHASVSLSLKQAHSLSGLLYFVSDSVSPTISVHSPIFFYQSTLDSASYPGNPKVAASLFSI